VKQSPDPRDWAQGWRAWALAAVLYLPMAAVVLSHLLLPPAGEWPTGFLQYDQQGYMAMAHEASEGPVPGPFGLPTSADPATPRIYFYPHLLALGLVQAFSDADPGRLYLLFGALSGLVFLRLAVALYGRVVAERDGAALLGLALFAWGGGLFVLAGGLASLVEGAFDYNSLFRFDPYGGFWFLNLGRNLFYGVEAYYHALAIGLLLALIDRRWRLALLLLALLAASHPFTGAQFLAVVLAWALYQRVFRRAESGMPPLWFLLGGAAVLALFAAYHLLLLPQSAEHRWIMERWSLAWTLDFLPALLAYAPVAVLALWALIRPDVPQPALPLPGRALLLATALVSLALAQHDLLIEPRQPLHFTRGYIWFPLFLLGAPLLVELLRRVRARWRPAGAALAALFLLDNAAWLAVQALQNAGSFGAARYLTPDERSVVARLANDEDSNTNLPGIVLVTDDERLGYDALVYSPLRSWYSHEHLTPWGPERLAEIQRWAKTGEEPLAWRQRPVLFVTRLAGRDPADLPWIAADSDVETIGQWLVVLRLPQLAN
jgi:hypothetical protein